MGCPYKIIPSFPFKEWMIIKYLVLGLPEQFHFQDIFRTGSDLIAVV